MSSVCVCVRVRQQLEGSDAAGLLSIAHLCFRSDRHLRHPRNRALHSSSSLLSAQSGMSVPFWCLFFIRRSQMPYPLGQIMLTHFGAHQLEMHAPPTRRAGDAKTAYTGNRTRDPRIQQKMYTMTLRFSEKITSLFTQHNSKHNTYLVKSHILPK